MTSRLAVVFSRTCSVEMTSRLAVVFSRTCSASLSVWRTVLPVWGRRGGEASSSMSPPHCVYGGLFSLYEGGEEEKPPPSPSSSFSRRREIYPSWPVSSDARVGLSSVSAGAWLTRHCTALHCTALLRVAKDLFEGRNQLTLIGLQPVCISLSNDLG